MYRTSLNEEDASILLIVEDRLLGGNLAATLEELGYRVIVSPDGERIVPALPASPDIVVVDAAASEQVDAFDVGDRLGRVLCRPVVYLVDDEEQASRVDEQAADATCVKWPFPTVALQAALRRALADAENEWKA